MNVLFIDDDPEDLELFSEAVKSFGPDYNVTMTTNGRDGVSLLKHTLPDFVFLDINMPAFDGKMVLKWIRRERSLDSVRVCILSTSITIADCQMYKEMGANHCLRKPSSFEELKTSLLLALKDNAPCSGLK